MIEFEPKIMGLLRNWCSDTRVDLGGASRIKYLPNMRKMRSVEH